MTWLSEDPWLVVGVLGAAALGCLIALKVTQQGKYLLWAGVLILVALAVIGIEQVWVTDNERIEAVIRDIGRAASRSDIDGVLANLTPDVVLEEGSTRLRGDFARAVIRMYVGPSRFDFLTISRLNAHAGQQSRTGTAEFRAHFSGSFPTPVGTMNYATGPEGSDWSFGLQETADKEWKVNRITATRLPRGAHIQELRP